MDITLNKDIKSTVNQLDKETQVHLRSLLLSYEDLKDNKILAMILGHGVDTLNIEICETIYTDAILALMLDAKIMCITSIETCDSSLDILSKMYPDKTGQFRRAKMLGKSLLGVIE